MKIIALIFGCLLFSAAEIRAQDLPKDLNSLQILPQPLPAGDLISQAPDSARWTVISMAATSTSVAVPSTPGAPKPTVYTITKSGKIYLVESVSPDGKKIVRWKDHQFQATYVPGVTNPLLAMGPGSLYFVDFSTSDFPEFSWITASNYVGMAKLGPTAMGLVFKARVETRDSKMGLLSMPHATPADAIALVDLKTRRPLMLQVQNEILLYQFTGGGAEVSLPPEVQKTFGALRQQIKRASMVPPG